MSRDEPAWMPTFILLTCEHGGRDVPAAYAALFDGHDAALASHRGFDIGALGVAQRMAAALAAPIIFSTVTRLLVDLNRSLDQPDAFSAYTSGLTDAARAVLVRDHYVPHRDAVCRTVDAATTAGHRVLHLGVHSCIDVLNDIPRALDISLLFDDTRRHELDVATRYRAALLDHDPHLRSPFNEPYHGADDGLTTTLRHAFAAERYVGIEIEVRQGLILTQNAQHAIGTRLARALRTIIPTVAARDAVT